MVVDADLHELHRRHLNVKGLSAGADDFHCESHVLNEHHLLLVTILVLGRLVLLLLALLGSLDFALLQDILDAVGGNADCRLLVALGVWKK